jgi:hypothetical protein
MYACVNRQLLTNKKNVCGGDPVACGSVKKTLCLGLVKLVFINDFYKFNQL